MSLPPSVDMEIQQSLQIITPNDLCLSFSPPSPSPPLPPLLPSYSTSPATSPPSLPLTTTTTSLSTMNKAPSCGGDEISWICESTPESAMEYLGGQITTRMFGFSSQNAEISKLLLRLGTVYARLTKIPCEELEEAYNKRLMSTSNLSNEMAVPMFVCLCLTIVHVNTAACELLHSKRNDLKKSTFIFNLFHPDYVMPFMRKWVDAFVNMNDFERMKIKLVAPGGFVCDCIMTVSTHRDPTSGIPLFDSFSLLRSDDL